MEAHFTPVSWLVAIAVVAHMSLPSETMGDTHTMGDTYDQRRQILLKNLAGKNHSYPKIGMGYALAKLALNQNVPDALNYVRTSNQNMDMTQWGNLLPNVAVYLYFKDKFTQSLRDKVKNTLTGWEYYDKINGTMNQRFYRATTGYLTATAWPSWSGAKAELSGCGKWLRENIERSSRRGFSEADSPTYNAAYVAALVVLNDFAEEADMKRIARAGLECMLLNLAPQWLKGYMISSSWRDYVTVQGPDEPAATSLIAWLYFGDSPPLNLDAYYHVEGFFAAIPAVSSYRPPDIILRIATDRAKPYVHRETSPQISEFGLKMWYGMWVIPTHIDRK